MHVDPGDAIVTATGMEVSAVDIYGKLHKKPCSRVLSLDRATISYTFCIGTVIGTLCRARVTRPSTDYGLTGGASKM